MKTCAENDSRAGPIFWYGNQTLANLVYLVGPNGFVRHLRFVHPWGDAAHADWDLLQSELGR